MEIPILMTIGRRQAAVAYIGNYCRQVYCRILFVAYRSSLHLFRTNGVN